MEQIFSSGVTEILNKLVGAVAHEVSLAWGVKDDLKKLQDTLEMILAKVADAEEKQRKNNELRLWLKRLKDVAYDADDVMDIFSYETLRRQQERHTLKKKVLVLISSSNPLAFRLKMAKKLKDINRRLDTIANDMGRFQLHTTPSNTAHDDTSELHSRQTTSCIDESETLGREDDRYEIVKILTTVYTSSSASAYNQNHEKASIISIVGMGGLGKTTLAQLVYNDELVKKHFEPRVWVCVSENFDLRTLLVKILESITLKTKFNNISNVDVLAKEAREELTGKKYLLVLDDLWNEDAEQWEKLKSLLVVGAQGSRVLITTRKIQVADVVRGSIPPYQLKPLQQDECWSIIAKKAFSGGGALMTSKMTDIGKEIAKKCYGLPLAAKFLGSLMHSKNKESDWLAIKGNDTWNTPENNNKILPVLKLSYDNLSPQLKRCFSYCSVFGKGCEINRETLIQLWMAEGFLDPSKSEARNKRPIEDIGNEYFESLMWSSFLEGVKKNELGDIKTCQLHDLVYDLAQAVVGDNECVTLNASELKNASEVRRLQLIMDEELSATFPESLSNLRKLRTVIVTDPSYSLDMNRFSSSKHLRVLYLGYLGKDCSGITYSTSKLRHLRYFCLINLNLSGQVINGSLDRLYCLQTLVLSGCLYVQDLLKNMGALSNLRHLDISYTDIEELPDSVTSLCNLQRLDLNHCNCLNAFPNSVSGLQCLRFLDMSFTPIEKLPDFILSLRNLQTLDVNSCNQLNSLPEYVTGLENLMMLNFKNCTLLKALPEDFGALTQLRYLNLEGTEIKVLPESCSNLYNLELASLCWCELPKEVTNWTKLRIFSYFKDETPMGIGKLLSLQSLSYAVREKAMDDKSDCNDGIEELGNLEFLEWLTIDRLQNVKNPMDARRANLKWKQNLLHLDLRWGEERLECKYRIDSSMVLEALQPPSGLKRLDIHNFMGRKLPTWMCVTSGLPKLTQLCLTTCKGLHQLPAAIGQLPCLRILILTNMSLKSLGIGEFPSLTELELIDCYLLEEWCYPYPHLQNLKIVGCESLIEIPSFPSLELLVLENEIDYKLLYSIGRSQTSLTFLSLQNVMDFVYFPISILQHNCNLHSLQIEGCNQFEGFGVCNDDNESEVVLLGPELPKASLHTLVFIDCPDLKFLPDLRGWTSLQKLTIFRCRQVKMNLTYDLKSLSQLKELYVDFIQRVEKRGVASVIEELVNLLE